MRTIYALDAFLMRRQIRLNFRRIELAALFLEKWADPTANFLQLADQRFLNLPDLGQLIRLGLQRLIGLLLFGTRFDERVRLPGLDRVPISADRGQAFVVRDSSLLNRNPPMR